MNVTCSILNIKLHQINVDITMLSIHSLVYCQFVEAHRSKNAKVDNDIKNSQEIFLF